MKHFAIFNSNYIIKSENNYVINYKHKNSDEIINKNNENFNDESVFTIIGTSYYLNDNVLPFIFDLPKTVPIYCLDDETNIKNLGDYLKTVNL